VVDRKGQIHHGRFQLLGQRIYADAIVVVREHGHHVIENSTILVSLEFVYGNGIHNVAA
jgi:hypothetical protein